MGKTLHDSTPVHPLETPRSAVVLAVAGIPGSIVLPMIFSEHKTLLGVCCIVTAIIVLTLCHRETAALWRRLMKKEKAILPGDFWFSVGVAAFLVVSGGWLIAQDTASAEPAKPTAEKQNGSQSGQGAGINNGTQNFYNYAPDKPKQPKPQASNAKQQTCDAKWTDELIRRRNLLWHYGNDYAAQIKPREIDDYYSAEMVAYYNDKLLKAHEHWLISPENLGDYKGFHISKFETSDHSYGIVMLGNSSIGQIEGSNINGTTAGILMDDNAKITKITCTVVNGETIFASGS